LFEEKVISDFVKKVNSFEIPLIEVILNKILLKTK
jgi:hypothetical protein